MIELREVRKTYPGTVALDGISLTVRPGELVAVVGPSGSGKTTLLNLMGRLLLPDEGEVLLNGRPAHTLKPGRDLARLVGIMDQQFNLVDSLPVVHNVLAGRLGEWNFLRSLWSLIVPQELDRAAAALERVGIGDKLFERTAHLSGGEKQRAALARLMVQNPHAILADEPVASVDPARAEDLVVMLTGIAREEQRTLIVSLHDPDLARRYFSRVIGLRDGRVAFDRPAQRITEEDLGAVYRLEAHA